MSDKLKTYIIVILALVSLTASVVIFSMAHEHKKRTNACKTTDQVTTDVGALSYDQAYCMTVTK